MNLETARRSDLAAGVWKFSDSISPQELLELGNRLLTQYPDRILRLQVRGCGDGQYGLDGVFKLKREGEKSFKKFLHQARARLKEEFGNDLVGWDISSPVYVLK